ncbi:MAG: hypothetical protein ONB43_03505 [candidate division KSB1 bacterium]|nr:hypothetical protein [candidate division KSB1 bacterium]MDZ7403029.1 hypothetical protein [candidate division KSB1 bacterium]
MYRTFFKKFVVSFLLLTGLMQGWPLLVSATCSMAEPQTMSQMGNCCCCENSSSSPSPAIASCNPGKSLVGILSTDSPLLPGSDKTGKFLPQEFAVAPVANLLSPSLSSPFPGFSGGELILPHTGAPPLYLVDCTFRL